MFRRVESGVIQSHTLAGKYDLLFIDLWLRSISLGEFLSDNTSFYLRSRGLKGTQKLASGLYTCVNSYLSRSGICDILDLFQYTVVVAVHIQKSDRLVSRQICTERGHEFVFVFNLLINIQLHVVEFRHKLSNHDRIGPCNGST